MKEKWEYIFDGSSCPTTADLEEYHAGKLPEEKRFAIENHLADCELCNDYLEGLALMPETVDLDGVENELKQEVHQLMDKNHKHLVIPLLVQRLGVAASILLIVGLTFYFSLYRSHESVQVAQQIRQEVSTPIKTGMKAENLESQKEIAKPDKAEPMAVASQKTNLKVTEEIKIIAEAKKEVERIDDEVSRVETVVVSEPEIEQDSKVMSVSGKVKTKAGKVKTLAHGVVVDETGQPLPGAVVTIKNRSEGVVSDESGSFEIAVLPGDSLQFNYIGYNPVVQSAVVDSELNVTLHASALALDEVVVVGYGVQKSRSVAAAVSSVRSSKKIRLLPSEKREIKTLNRQYANFPDSVKDEWLETKYHAELCLIQKTSDAADLLNQLLILTNNEQKHDTIRQAIKYAEEEEYRKARRLITGLKK